MAHYDKSKNTGPHYGQKGGAGCGYIPKGADAHGNQDFGKKGSTVPDKEHVLPRKSGK